MKLSTNKKGVELTFNTIVIIVLVLLVLVILSFILIKTIGSGQTAMSCTANNGECHPKCPPSDTSEYKYAKPYGCPDKEVCCTKNLLG